MLAITIASLAQAKTLLGQTDAVVSLCLDIEPGVSGFSPPPGMPWHQIPVRDTGPGVFVPTDDPTLRRWPSITAHQVHDLLAFTKALPDAARLLVHCHAGSSRSTAAALVIRAQELGPGREVQAWRWLLSSTPHAFPTGSILLLGDQALGCQGRLCGPWKTAQEQPLGPERSSRQYLDYVRAWLNHQPDPR